MDGLSTKLASRLTTAEQDGPLGGTMVSESGRLNSRLLIRQYLQLLHRLAPLVFRAPVRPGIPPAGLDRLMARGPELEAPDVQCRRGLPVALVRHHRVQVGPRDRIEQLLLVRRQPRPDVFQRVNLVHVGNDRVMAGDSTTTTWRPPPLPLPRSFRLRRPLPAMTRPPARRCRLFSPGRRATGQDH